MQVAIHSVGICGSDVHFYASGKCGPFELTEPTIMGHESAGVVSKVGPGVTHLKPGELK